MEFAKYVASLRKKKGMSQKELADILGFTPQGISRFESLDSAFDLSLVPLLCKTLDCSLNDLYTRADDPKYVSFPFDVNLLAQNVRDMRIKKGLSQATLASAVGITERSLRAYERGDANPSYQVTEKIVVELGVDIDYLFVMHLDAIPQATPTKRRRPFALAYAGVGLAVVIGLSIGLPIALQARNRVLNEPSSSNKSVSDSSSPTESSSEPSNSQPTLSASADMHDASIELTYFVKD